MRVSNWRIFSLRREVKKIICMIQPYIALMRWDKPIGILLLLWPTLWALWLAQRGMPDAKILSVFVLGVMVMRSAGCIINDIADRGVDAFVQRTANRPLARGVISLKSAVLLFFILMMLALLLVSFLNRYTICLSFIGALLAVIYPYLKRITHLPQLGLGFAFSWSVPMAFAAIQQRVPPAGWLLFFTAMVWPIIYDTMYAMTDRADDIRIGIKSTAILFAHWDKRLLGFLQLLFLVGLIAVGKIFSLNYGYDVALLGVAMLFGYQQKIISTRVPALCFRAFLNNHWVGLIIFIGVLIGLSK